VPASPNHWMRIQQHLFALTLTKERAPSADLVVEAQRLLLWLCSERSPAPQAVATGGQGSIIFRWDQAGSWFEVEVTHVGRAKWRARTPEAEILSGPLNAQAIELLRSIIPMARR